VFSEQNEYRFALGAFLYAFVSDRGEV